MRAGNNRRPYLFFFYFGKLRLFFCSVPLYLRPPILQFSLIDFQSRWGTPENVCYREIFDTSPSPGS